MLILTALSAGDTRAKAIISLSTLSSPKNGLRGKDSLVDNNRRNSTQSMSDNVMIHLGTFPCDPSPYCSSVPMQDQLCQDENDRISRNRLGGLTYSSLNTLKENKGQKQQQHQVEEE